jgi:hypothetical protein
MNAIISIRFFLFGLLDNRDTSSKAMAQFKGDITSPKSQAKRAYISNSKFGLKISVN